MRLAASGSAKLRARAGGGNARETVDAIFHAADDFAAGAEVFDDQM